ncbi:hypothetical protein FPV67DRAFT_1527766 [Lyophyllum atratum]|nr:hypothetical protein FPV67DRAFT_1527766 [Lyophyllum atratum]
MPCGGLLFPMTHLVVLDAIDALSPFTTSIKGPSRHRFLTFHISHSPIRSPTYRCINDPHHTFFTNHQNSTLNHNNEVPNLCHFSPPRRSHRQSHCSTQWCQLRIRKGDRYGGQGNFLEWRWKWGQRRKWWKWR